LFLAHEADVDEMLDIQLQFKSKILKKNFVNLSAEYVVGSESANPEYSYGYSYKMSCNGQVQ